MKTIIRVEKFLVEQEVMSFIKFDDNNYMIHKQIVDTVEVGISPGEVVEEYDSGKLPESLYLKLDQIIYESQLDLSMDNFESIEEG